MTRRTGEQGQVEAAEHQPRTDDVGNAGGLAKEDDGQGRRKDWCRSECSRRRTDTEIADREVVHVASEGEVEDADDGVDQGVSQRQVIDGAGVEDQDDRARDRY